MTERDQELIAFGLTIRQAREEKGMSPDALAAAAGVEREHLDAIEAGRVDPAAVDVLVALADGLSVGLAVLMRRADALKAERSAPPPLPAADEHSLTGGRPPVVLRERLAAARRAGASFHEAWPGALMAAVNAVC